MRTTEREQDSGLEVQVPTNPEVAAQPYESKYPIGDGGSDHNMGDRRSNSSTFYQANQSGHQSQIVILGRSRAFWMLGVITVVCLIVALGAGLGAGLAPQHKPSSAR